MLLAADFDFERNLLVQTLAPLVLVALFALPGLVILIIGHIRGWTPDRQATQINITNSFYNNILFMAFLIYPNVSLIR